MAKTNQNQQAIIAAEGLTKSYPGMARPALDSLTLQVRAGEVYGFLGPNGAGKSTAIRLLMNFIQPTKGKASVQGKDIVRDSVDIKKSVGYLSGDFAVYPKMTGKQYLEYMGELQPADRAYAADITRRLQADLMKRLGDLSRGNRQKIGIIQAFMHKPQVLILDEPTSGLDPLMQEVFYDLVGEAKERGAAVFVSSHILGEVQKICDRIGIIREGRLIEEQSIDDMGSAGAQVFAVTFGADAPLDTLRNIKGLKVIAGKGREVTVQLQGDLSPLFAVLARHKVTRLESRGPDLEDVFLGFYEDKEVAA